MIITQTGIVDIIPEYNRALRPIFCVSEGDADSRMINITVQNAGNNFNIPEGASVYVAGKKHDNTIFTYECSYSGYIVTFPITEQMSAVSGLVLCEIQIVVAGDPLGSANFCFWVEPSPIENGTTSESDLNIFVQAIADLGGYEFLTDEVAVLSARMDQFARLPDGSLSTAADAELADIRVMNNGTTAATAGDSVREQFGELQIEIDAIGKGEKTTRFAFEVGTINNGVNQYNATSYRTVGFYPTSESETLTARNTVRGSIFYYNEDKTYANVVDYFNESLGLIKTINSNYPFFRIAFTTKDYSSLPDFEDVEVTAESDVQKQIDVLAEKVEPIDEIAEIIDENFTEQYITEIGSKTTSKYINASGVVSDISNAAYFVNSYEEAPGNKLMITAFAGYRGYFYAFYDSNDAFISGHQSENGASTTIVDEVVTAPPGTAKLVVAGNTSSPLSGIVKKSNGFVSNASLKWLGKKWVVVGDSLTAINSRTTKHYFDYVSEATGISVVNMGDSGSGYRTEQDQGTAFYQRISDVPTDADVVTIFGSFNDGLTDIGTATDTGTETIGGCVNQTIDNLYAAYPTVQLGIVSPTPWIAANPYNHPEANAYAELLEAICKRRSIPFLNLYFESNLRPWDANFRTLAYSKDDGNGVHPDETGHRIIASRFLGFLDSLIV